MGFWDKAWQVTKDLGEGVANSISEKANEVRQAKEKFESMSDDELIRIANSDGFFGKSQTEKGVALRILQSRGYDPHNLPKAEQCHAPDAKPSASLRFRHR